MSKGVAGYLATRAVRGAWTLEGPDLPEMQAAVVIPCLAESARLFETLEDLREQPEDALARTLVVCVVNNRPPGVARAEDIEDNLRTLDRLRAWRAHEPGALRLALVDAASPEHELPRDGGVGMARKIGLDLALARLLAASAAEGPLVCLDADTRVPPGYLPALLTFYARPGRWCGVLDFAHPIPGDPEEQAAIVRYELFLRLHVLGLRHMGSPYAFHTVGSTMSCTAAAYAAVSGMNQRQAGEDFYFLQQLAKTGPVGRIPGAPVVPSSRASHRVPFGTGQRVGRYLAEGGDPCPAYHPSIYEVLRQWLEMVGERAQEEGAGLLEGARGLSPALADFLDAQQFVTAWARIGRQARTPLQQQRQFHGWFDGFRTLKCIHHFRDHVHPNVEPLAALQGFRDLGALPQSGPAPATELAALEWLRRLQAEEEAVQGLGHAVFQRGA